MDSHYEEMEVRLNPNEGEIKASKEEIIANMKVWHEEIKASQEPWRTYIKIGLEEVKALDLEASPEEVEVVVEHQKAPDEEAAMETIGALEDRYGDRCLTVRCRRQLKKWNQGDGGLHQKVAVPCNG
jgi:hypothetical protein